MKQIRIDLGSLKELVSKGMSIDEAMAYFESVFINDFGIETLTSLKNKLSNCKIVDEIVYLELPSVDYVWFADRTIEKMAIDKRCSFQYLIKAEKTEQQYFYRGIRAVSVRLFASCGGQMSNERELWWSIPGSLAVKAKSIVFEDNDI